MLGICLIGLENPLKREVHDFYNAHIPMRMLWWGWRDQKGN